MKVILGTANELLEAFDNLPNNEKQNFLLALHHQNKAKTITQKDDSVNPLDFFGLCKGQDIDAKKLRSDAWNNRI